MFLNSTRMVSMALAVFAIGSGTASAQGTMQQQDACRPDSGCSSGRLWGAQSQSGMTASDQHHPASSRAIATLATT